jgi:hypothetical protein
LPPGNPGHRDLAASGAIPDDTADAFAEIRRAFGQYGVVFFRDQDLTPEQHVAFAERFAPIDINRFFTANALYRRVRNYLEHSARRQVFPVAKTVQLLSPGMLRNRWFADSAQEGGVYCELVSEVGFPGFRFQ